MVFFFGNVADASEEVEGGGEVLHAPLAADFLAVGAELPSRHVGKIMIHLLAGQLGYSSFARHTVFLCQCRSIGSSHHQLLSAPGSSEYYWMSTGSFS